MSSSSRTSIRTLDITCIRYTGKVWVHPKWWLFLARSYRRRIKFEDNNIFNFKFFSTHAQILTFSIDHSIKWLISIGWLDQKFVFFATFRADIVPAPQNFELFISFKFTFTWWKITFLCSHKLLQGIVRMHTCYGTGQNLLWWEIETLEICSLSHTSKQECSQRISIAIYMHASVHACVYTLDDATEQFCITLNSPMNRKYVVKSNGT